MFLVNTLGFRLFPGISDEKASPKVNELDTEWILSLPTDTNHGHKPTAYECGASDCETVHLIHQEVDGGGGG